MSHVLIMIVEKGFYMIESVPDVPLEKQARDNGILNPHVTQVRDFMGKLLWDRESEKCLS